MKTYSILLLIFLLIATIACDKTETKSVLDDYNILWSTQSENASESMPLVGGDIGCNVWVENGDILLYVQRSGSLSENGEYPDGGGPVQSAEGPAGEDALGD